MSRQKKTGPRIDLDGGWSIHDDHLCHDASGYDIPLSDLLNGYPGHEPDTWEYNWPQHMARKSWVDPRLFFMAWLKACEVEGVTLDPAILRETFKYAFDSKTSPRRAAVNAAAEAATAARIAAGGPRFELIDVSKIDFDNLPKRPGWLE